MAISKKTTLILACILSSIALAEVKLSAMFTDNMVMQQNAKAAVWGWADAGEEVTVKASWQKKGKTVKADADGNWMVKVKTPKAGGPYELKVVEKNTITLKNILIGEVWLASGQSNMEMRLGDQGSWNNGVLDWEKELAQADNPNLRLYSVRKITANSPVKDCQGQWQLSSGKSVKDFSAVAYFFAQKLQKELNVPVGIINCCWAGTGVQAWMSEGMLQSDPDFKQILKRYKTNYEDYQKLMVDRSKVIGDWKKACEKAKDDGKEEPKEPRWLPPYATGCYNGMLLPVSKYTLKGFIWYQGEGNIWGAYLYRKLLSTMIEGWRDMWGTCDMPFYIVQLANFQANSSKEPFQSSWAELRDSQLHVTKTVKNTGVAVTIDVGNPANVHPRNKKPVGQRLALWALKKDYKKNIPHSGPIYKSMKVKDDSIILKFDNIEKGLLCKGDSLTSFAIASEDEKFVEANAKIVGKTVVISSDKIKNPIAVRYGWQDSPACNLYNSADLPAGPFRTDSFPAITANNK